MTGSCRVLLCCLQGAVGLQGLVELRRQGLVQDQQVDLVDAELAAALVEAVQGLVVAVVADPDLGLEKPRTVKVGGGDGFANLALVAVDGGGVDVAVAGLQAAVTASRVSSGGVWNTPSPRAGRVTPLFRVRVVTSGMDALSVGGLEVGRGGQRLIQRCMAAG
jgi:hypothetical protein